jgi:hypothetical protein
MNDMGTSVWGIVGFGLKVEKEMFDWRKCAHKCVTEALENVTNEDEFYNFLNDADICFDGLLREIVEGQKHIDYIGGADSDEGDYILFFPGYPWDYTEDDLKITEESAREQLYKCMKPYLKDSITEDFFKKRIEYISTYGIG